VKAGQESSGRHDNGSGSTAAAVVVVLVILIVVIAIFVRRRRRKTGIHILTQMVSDKMFFITITCRGMSVHLLTRGNVKSL
jgi:high-affinity Fe2+/Pb2+ permease